MFLQVDRLLYILISISPFYPQPLETLRVVGFVDGGEILLEKDGGGNYPGNQT